MAKSSATPDLDDLQLSDPEDTSDLFASPGQPRKKTSEDRNEGNASSRNASRTRIPKNYEEEDNREARLRQELESIRRVNKVIEDAVDSLEKAKGNMETVSRTVTNATTLLSTWTRILSQTEHNQRLILNPNWHGSTQDLADIESENLQRQQMAERAAVEEQARREAAQRRAEEEARRREIEAARPGRGTRGRGRATGSSSSMGRAAATGSRAGYTGVGGQSGRGGRGGGSTAGRGGSGIGRGAAAGVRGRSRGMG
ncbi:MAG: hypothetical protein M1820_005553 [Bogoriella megaspora]|nr:MAG: hypothetical protein M1820_005553 [Bogoriella megaspora]